MTICVDKIVTIFAGYVKEFGTGFSHPILGGQNRRIRILPRPLKCINI